MFQLRDFFLFHFFFHLSLSCLLGLNLVSFSIYSYYKSFPGFGLSHSCFLPLFPYPTLIALISFLRPSLPYLVCTTSLICITLPCLSALPYLVSYFLTLPCLFHCFALPCSAFSFCTALPFLILHTSLLCQSLSHLALPVLLYFLSYHALGDSDPCPTWTPYPGAYFLHICLLLSLSVPPYLPFTHTCSHPSYHLHLSPFFLPTVPLSPPCLLPLMSAAGYPHPWTHHMLLPPFLPTQKSDPIFAGLHPPTGVHSDRVAYSSDLGRSLVSRVRS